MSAATSDPAREPSRRERCPGVGSGGPSWPVIVAPSTRSVPGFSRHILTPPLALRGSDPSMGFVKCATWLWEDRGRGYSGER